jgi:type I restriction enzyme S subunit
VKWRQVQLKQVASVRVSNVDKKSVETERAVRLCNYVDVYRNEIIDSSLDFMQATASPGQIRTFGLQAGDTVITKDSETADDIGVPAYVRETVDDLVCGYHLALIRPGSEVEPRFLHWTLASQPVREQASVAATGVTRFGLRQDSIKSAHFQVPGLEEQRRIADFLDAETARIQDLVEMKRRLVVLLEERVEHMMRLRISQSSLVDGGGEGRSLPLKRVLKKLRRVPHPGAEMITAYRDGQVTARTLRRAEGYTESWTEGTSVQGVCANDVVVHGLDGFAGAIGTAEVDGACSPVYHVCEPRAGGDSFYLGKMLRLLSVSGYLVGFAVSTRERAYDFRNWGMFGAIPIPDVANAEQREIGNSIRLIAPLRAAVASSEALADERRRALITAAVTGRLDVTTARGVA